MAEREVPPPPPPFSHRNDGNRNHKRTLHARPAKSAVFLPADQRDRLQEWRSAGQRGIFLRRLAQHVINASGGRRDAGLATPFSTWQGLVRHAVWRDRLCRLQPTAASWDYVKITPLPADSAPPVQRRREAYIKQQAARVSHPSFEYLIINNSESGTCVAVLQPHRSFPHQTGKLDGCRSLTFA